MSTGQPLDYEGPAAINGVEFSEVRLREYLDGHLRGWEGTSRIPAARIPEGFSPNFAGNDPVPVELPDGRHGMALVTNVSFDGTTWTIDLTGTGPAPGCTQP